MNALNGCNNDVAGFLIRQGADINIKSNDGATALILACGCSEDIAKQLLEKGADIHALTDKGNGVFTQCTSMGLRRETVSYVFAEYLLAQGADIDEANTTSWYKGYTPCSGLWNLLTKSWSGSLSNTEQMSTLLQLRAKHPFQ